MRKLLKIFGLLALLATVAVLVLGLWARTHEDELKQKAISALEAGLLTDMDIGSIELSVFEHFPNVSLTCGGVMLTDTYGKGDTLLWAESLGLELSVFRVIRGDYSFKKVRVSEGGVHLEREVDGRDNYHFWRTTGGSDSSKTVLDIEAVALRNIHFRLRDRSSDVFVETLHLSADVKGSINDQLILFEGSLETPHLFVEAAQKRWMSGLPVSGSLRASIDNGERIYDFNDVTLDVNRVDLDGKARFAIAEAGVECSIDADLDGIDLKELNRMLPEEEAAILKPYALDGKASGRFRMLGISGARSSPNWTVAGEIEDGWVQHRESDIAVDAVDAAWSVSGGSGDPGKLSLTAFEGNLEGSRFELRGELSNFAEPGLDLYLDGTLALGDVQRFLSADSIGTLTGEAEVHAHYTGRLPVREDANGSGFDVELLRQASLGGSVELDDVGLDLHSLPRPIEDLNGYFELKGNKGSIAGATMTVGATDIELDGSLSNLLPWLFSDREALEITARCKSDHFYMASFLTDGEETADDNGTENYHLELPDNLRIRLDVALDRFSFRDFEASSVNGKASLTPAGVFMDPLQFNTAEGRFTLRCSATPKSGGFGITAHGDIRGVDISKLFVGFENFGQDFLTAEHVRGRADVDATLKAYMNDQLDIDPKSIVSDIDLRIDNGELIDLQSMQHIAAYMQENKLIAPFVRGEELRKELRHIRFETLENRIEIKDERIVMPTMDIQSSALDIVASGAHWFDQRIDYTITLYLRDLLVQKDQSEFGIMEDDGLGNRFFLSMRGTVDDPEFGYDRLARKEQKKKERQEGKEALKEALKEELGSIFKKKEDNEEKTDAGDKNHEITVQWGDEEAPKKDKPKEEKKDGDDKKKRRWRILSPDDDDEETLASPPIDDDDF